MKGNALISVFAGLCLLMISCVIPAGAQAPVLPHAFFGAIEVAGTLAPSGIQIEARGAGVLIGKPGNPITTTEVGRYGGSGAFAPKLVVQGAIANGTPIEFFVNGVRAECAEPGKPWQNSYPFASGVVTELNLRVTQAIPPGDQSTPTPTSTAIAILPTGQSTSTPTVTTTPPVGQPTSTSTATTFPSATSLSPTPTVQVTSPDALPTSVPTVELTPTPPTVQPTIRPIVTAAQFTAQPTYIRPSVATPTSSGDQSGFSATATTTPLSKRSTLEPVATIPTVTPGIHPTPGLTSVVAMVRPTSKPILGPAATTAVVDSSIVQVSFCKMTGVLRLVGFPI